MKFTFDTFTDALRRVRQTQLSALRAEVALMKWELERRQAEPQRLIDRILSGMNGEFVTMQQMKGWAGPVSDSHLMKALQEHRGRFQREHLRPGPGKPQRYRKLTTFAMIVAMVFLLAGCKAPPRRADLPPMPTRPAKAGTPTVSPKYSLASVPLPPPAPAKTNVVLNWDYDWPMPDPDGQIVFELWSTQNLSQPFTRKAVVSAPPVSFPIASPSEYFICRASNVLSKLTSGWNE